jgi:hypothetical protein
MRLDDFALISDLFQGKALIVLNYRARTQGRKGGRKRTASAMHPERRIAFCYSVFKVRRSAAHKCAMARHEGQLGTGRVCDGHLRLAKQLFDDLQPLKKCCPSLFPG